MNKDEYFNYLNTKDKDLRLEEMEAYASLNKVPIILPDGIGFIRHMIKIHESKKILEIGTAIGYSAIQFALIRDDISITSIERDETMYQEAVKNINKFNLNDRIHLIFNDALEVSNEVLESSYDVLFIDAAKSQYQKFFEKYSPLLKKGGIIVTDNLIFHDLVFSIDIPNKNTKQLVQKIKNYNEWLKNNLNYDTYFYPIGDGIAISIKK